MSLANRVARRFLQAGSKLTKEQISERLMKGADALFKARGAMRDDSTMLQDALDDATGVVTKDMYGDPLVKETRDKMDNLDHLIGDCARQMEHLARHLKKK
jgi:inosine/xanthosine triphosphate pyrophosphatase family protein